MFSPSQARNFLIFSSLYSGFTFNFRRLEGSFSDQRENSTFTSRKIFNKFPPRKGRENIFPTFSPRILQEKLNFPTWKALKKTLRRRRPIWAKIPPPNLGANKNIGGVFQCFFYFAKKNAAQKVSRNQKKNISHFATENQKNPLQKTALRAENPEEKTQLSQIMFSGNNIII